MLEGKPSSAGSEHTTPGYSYPVDLARFVHDRWGDVPGPTGGANPLPDASALEGFFAACYQASMLREEERQVVFRAILAEPTLFDPEGRPPEGFLAAQKVRVGCGVRVGRSPQDLAVSETDAATRREAAVEIFVSWYAGVGRFTTVNVYAARQMLWSLRRHGLASAGVRSTP